MVAKMRLDDREKQKLEKLNQIDLNDTSFIFLFGNHCVLFLHSIESFVKTRGKGRFIYIIIPSIYTSSRILTSLAFK